MFICPKIFVEKKACVNKNRQQILRVSFLSKMVCDITKMILRNYKTCYF